MNTHAQSIYLDPRLGQMHQVMLGDRTRLEAYDKALERDVRPGDVVVDVGAGCLALTLLALRHGAGHVYAIEGDPATARIAGAILADNGIADRVTVVEGDARTVSLPRRADVLVSEMLGNIGPEEEMGEILAICAERHLKSGGAIIPQRLTTVINAIRFDGESWGIWSDDLAGYSLAAARPFLGSSAQLHFFARPPELLSETTALAAIDLGRPPGALPEHCDIDIIRPGRLDALALAFEADFGDGIRLSNFPGYPGCNWAVFIWPLASSQVAAGDGLRVSIRPGAWVRDALSWQIDCGIRRRTQRDLQP